MFTYDELKLFDDQFKQVGITEEDKQRKVLEFFFTMGKIMYQLKNDCYEGKN